MTSRPLVSVVLPVRDAARTLSQALDSILGQTFGDFEVLAYDDGSTDESLAILSAAAERDHRVLVTSRASLGLTATLNEGIARARGTYIARQDADDVSEVQRFERQVAYLRDHPDLAALGTGAVAVDDEGREIQALPGLQGAREVRRGLTTLRATPVHGSMMMRRDRLQEAGGYRQAFHAAQDFDLWLRLSEQHAIDNLVEPLYKWRLHSASVYARKRASQLMYAGIALMFAREREAGGGDSYGLLERCDGDLDRFSRAYRLRGALEARWGELLFRGLDEPRVARRHLWSALCEGHVRVGTLCLYGWSLFGLHWPGGRTLQASSTEP